MEELCRYHVPVHSQNNKHYVNLFAVADSQILELSVAKDLIVNEVRAI